MNKNDAIDFRQIVTQARDAIFSTNESFVITSWNPAAERLYGYKAQTVIGTPLGLLLRSSISKLERSLQLEALQRDGYHKGDYEFFDKDGSPLYIHASITVLKGPRGEIIGYVAIHQNISDRKMVEEHLKQFNSALEEQVINKSAQLTSIFERITDAFVALDMNMCYTYMNRKAGEIFHRNPALMLGKHIWTEFPEGVGLPFYHAYHEAMKKQAYIRLEDYYPPYDRWFENHIYPSPDGLSIFFRDITEQKLIEQQARLSSQRLSLHLTNSPLAVVEWDTESIITTWSEQAQRIFGWSKEEAQGKSIEELKLVHEEDVTDVNNVIGELFKGATATFKGVNKNYTKDGNVIFCEWYSSVLTDHEGKIISCMSLVQDITERRKAEEALKVNEHQLSLIYNSGTDILFLLQVDGERYRFISVNEAFKKATGLPAERILNKFVEEVIPSPSSELVMEKYREAIQTGQAVSWEEETEYPAGVKTGLVNVTPVYDERGHCIRLVGSVHDITPGKIAQAELREKNEQLRQLSAHLQEIREEERANIAREIHDELGERLTGIRLDISWLQNHLPSSANEVQKKFPDLLQMVDDTIKTVRKISSDLRPSILDDFGLVDALEWQAMEFQKRTGIVCGVKSFLKRNINNKKIDITLFRIFQESLTNVLRHSHAKSVCAQLLEQDNHLEFTITDNGVGMDLETIREKKTLGLIGMKERVFMVNGDYNISSEPGKGTTITVLVPVS
ncbi:PAS domain S-box protein [Segetibacter sp. 3557_3]|uniref:PAS domain-containing sensor histidine kinase n=1 Tax=Segetibacter sp. 3557_3 TaxID=2547429 RepID=UPI0010586D54|nr:PAS domain S-box protein [Segetibacter sp. 3557_3]TDH28551.1 PAS domain S-box protein [Segetibacter sp. 3557_3]